VLRDRERIGLGHALGERAEQRGNFLAVQAGRVL
jgi:hypothetical protein